MDGPAKVCVTACVHACRTGNKNVLPPNGTEGVFFLFLFSLPGELST